MKILDSWPRAKKLGRNFIVLARSAVMFWYPPGIMVVGNVSSEADSVPVMPGVSGAALGGVGVGIEEVGGWTWRSCCCWLRRALMRAVRYSATWTRISIPGFQGYLLVLCVCIHGVISCLSRGRNIPTIRVSGRTGASPTSNPPNPHPMSTTSTSFSSFLAPARLVCMGSGFVKAGKCVLQSICAGVRGLYTAQTNSRLALNLPVEECQIKYIGG